MPARCVITAARRLLGERTFGKGSVQTVIPLRDGQALKLTTSLYFTPSGTSIHERGIEPDIAIGPTEVGQARHAPVAPMKDAAVLTALQYLKDRGLGTHYAAVKTDVSRAAALNRHRAAPRAAGRRSAAC